MFGTVREDSILEEHHRVRLRSQIELLDIDEVLLVNDCLHHLPSGGEVDDDIEETHESLSIFDGYVDGLEEELS